MEQSINRIKRCSEIANDIINIYNDEIKDNNNVYNHECAIQFRHILKDFIETDQQYVFQKIHNILSKYISFYYTLNIKHNIIDINVYDVKQTQKDIIRNNINCCLRECFSTNNYKINIYFYDDKHINQLGDEQIYNNIIVARLKKLGIEC